MIKIEVFTTTYVKKYLPCSKCNGKGEVLTSSMNNLIPTDAFMSDCKECNGTGKKVIRIKHEPMDTPTNSFILSDSFNELNET